MEVLQSRRKRKVNTWQLKQVYVVFHVRKLSNPALPLILLFCFHTDWKIVFHIVSLNQVIYNLYWEGTVYYLFQMNTDIVTFTCLFHFCQILLKTSTHDYSKEIAVFFNAFQKYLTIAKTKNTYQRPNYFPLAQQWWLAIEQRNL